MPRRDEGIGERKCRDGHPMPDGLPKEERDRWFHYGFETVFRGQYFDRLRCRYCGHEVLASPQR